jgi:diguanylate cyclase (GGDEF)-like protein/PAS domain S-box-containing protein
VAVGLEFRVEPAKFRLIFAGLLVGALGLVWIGYAAARILLIRSAETGLSSRIEVDTLVLEDHVSRSLDVVAGRLRGAEPLTETVAGAGAESAGASLGALILSDSVLRSLSLVDDLGRVVASSSPGNLGALVPQDAIPRPTGEAWRAGEVAYGSVIPYRDLREIAAGNKGAVNVWLAALHVEAGRRSYFWVAAINPGLFENFWARLDEDPATEIAIYDYRGQRLVSHHAVVPPGESFSAELLRETGQRAIGFYKSTVHPSLMVAYRVSQNHPVLVAVVGDRERLGPEVSGSIRTVIYGAVGMSGVILLVFGLLYWGYLRYEVSVIEATNQARAIGAHLMVSEATPEGIILKVNDAFLSVSGYTQAELVGQSHSLLKSGLHPAEFYDELWGELNAGRIWKGTLCDRNKAGDLFWVNATIVPFKDAWGRVTRLVGYYTDISEAIFLSEQFESEREMREQLAKANRSLTTSVNSDPLTGAANRRGFEGFIERVLAGAGGRRQTLTILSLDIDFFKRINDTYGHAAGDQVLREMASRWEGEIRASDMLARLGGEEFCVVLPQTGPGQGAHVAEKLRSVTAATPVNVTREGEAIALSVTVSIGVASADDPVRTGIDRLLEDADQALYAAKHEGRNRVVSAVDLA